MSVHDNVLCPCRHFSWSREIRDLTAVFTLYAATRKITISGKSKAKTCCECAGRELREPRFKQEQEDTSTSSTEYQKRIYRVSADILRFHKAVEGFRSPTIIVIYNTASEVIAGPAKAGPTSCSYMYFIRILFGINNCLGKGKAIFSWNFVCVKTFLAVAWNTRSHSFVYIYLCVSKISKCGFPTYVLFVLKLAVELYIYHINLARVHWWEPVLLFLNPTVSMWRFKPSVSQIFQTILSSVASSTTTATTKCHKKSETRIWHLYSCCCLCLNLLLRKKRKLTFRK